MEALFDESRLQGLRFATIQLAFDTLSADTKRSGFLLSSKYSFSFPYATFYRSNGGREQEKRTAKVGCPFKVCLSLVDSDHGPKVVKYVKGTLQHRGHDLLKEMDMHDLLYDTMNPTMRSLGDSGATYALIQTFIAKHFQLSLSTLTVHRVCGIDAQTDFDSHCDHVKQASVLHGGSVESYDHPEKDEMHRLAVFSQTLEDIANLRRY
jgi:hypothetical protein